MTNQIYFEINATVSSVDAIPAQILIVFASKFSSKQRIDGKMTKISLVKFYGISTTSALAFNGELQNCRMRAAAPMIVRDYLMSAAQTDAYWRATL